MHRSELELTLTGLYSSDFYDYLGDYTDYIFFNDSVGDEFFESTGEFALVVYLLTEVLLAKSVGGTTIVERLP